MGRDRNMAGRYLIEAEGVPSHGPRWAPASKLDGFKPYPTERVNAVGNGQVLLRELREGGYGGGYTILEGLPAAAADRGAVVAAIGREMRKWDLWRSRVRAGR